MQGEKTEKEKFAGAEETYTIETLTYDGRALQSGTSHYIGQNFAKPFDVKFQNREGEQEYAYQTSWGISTRLIGAIIMAHGDNRGLKLPPYIAPIQIVIIPVAQEKGNVLEEASNLKTLLDKKFRTHIDTRDNYSVGYKFNDWEMRGVPVRVEIGPRDIENGVVVVTRRDTLEKNIVKRDELQSYLENLMDDIQKSMFNACKKRVQEKTTIAHNMDEIAKNLEENQGYVKSMWCGSRECEEKVKEVTGAPSRCMPFEQENLGNTCVCCGKKADKMIVWGRQY